MGKVIQDSQGRVVVDDPKEGFIAMPLDVASRAGYEPLLDIHPNQIPKEDSARRRMTDAYRQNRADRIKREQAAEAKRNTRTLVYADDGSDNLTQMSPESARQQGVKTFPDLRDEDIPEMDSPEMGALLARLRGKTATQSPLAKVPAVKALQNIQRFTEAVPATPVAPPEPQIDVSPVGRMDAPAMPRALPMPSAQARPAAAPDFAVTPPTRMQMSSVAPAMPPQQEESEDIAPPAAWDVPTPAPMRVAAPEPERAVAAPTALDIPKAPPPMASEWSRDFSPASTRMPDDEGKALLALAKSQSNAPAGARAAAFSPVSDGVRTVHTFQDYDPNPAASRVTYAGNDEALLKELRDAQRSDGYSAGMRALGDQFRDAMNLILNIQGPKSNMAAGAGGYLEAAKARQALLAAQAKARRDERMTDAAVSAKSNDAAKDAAALDAAKAKAEKTAKDAATAASLNDPASPESGRIRETVTQLLGQRVDASTLAKLSGAELKDVALKYGVSLTNAEQNAGLKALQISQSGADTDYANSLRAQAIAIQEQELELARARLAQQQAQFGETLKDKEQARADAREDKTQAHSEKMAQLNVGGFAFDAKNPPSITGAKAMAEVAVAKDEVLGSLNKLESLYRKNGPTMIGPVAGEMETEWMNITNRLRTLNEMGVPNGADYLMLAKQLQDPTSIRAKGTSAARAQAQFSQLRDQVKRKVDATAKAYKYTPASATEPPDIDLSTEVKEPPVPGAPASVPSKTPSSSQVKDSKPKPGQVKIKRTDNNTYYLATEKRAAELIKKDPALWQEVERG